MGKKRNNKQHIETILVPTGNQALQATGNLSTTGNAVNLADGQLGVICASHDVSNADLNWGDFLPASTSASDVDAIKVVLGSQYSSNTALADQWGIKKPFYQSPIIRRDKVRSFSARISKAPSHHVDVFHTFGTPEDLTEYKIYIEMRSVRNDRDFGGNVDVLPLSYVTPNYTNTATLTDEDDELIQQLAFKVNLQSKALTVAPSYKSRGRKPVLALAINSGGGAGTALNTIACGDSIDILTSNGVTSSIVATRAFVESIKDLVAASCGSIDGDSTIEVIDITTAGTSSGKGVDALAIVGLDQDIATSYDDIYSVKTRVDVEMGGAFQTATTPESCTTSYAFDGYGQGRQWRIRYDERAFGTDYSLQLTGFKDNVIVINNNIDESKEYSAFILDFYDDEETLTVEQTASKRLVILVDVPNVCIPQGALGTFDTPASDGDTIDIGGLTFEHDGSSNGVAGDNIAFDGTDADLATQIEANIDGVTATAGTGDVTVTRTTTNQATTISDLNGILGYWLDTARDYGNAFALNFDSELTDLAAPDGSGDPTGVVPGSGVYFA